MAPVAAVTLGGVALAAGDTVLSPAGLTVDAAEGSAHSSTPGPIYTGASAPVAVPEPASLLLLIAGIAVLSWIGYRRRFRTK